MYSHLDPKYLSTSWKQNCPLCGKPMRVIHDFASGNKLKCIDCGIQYEPYNQRWYIPQKLNTTAKQDNAISFIYAMTKEPLPPPIKQLYTEYIAKYLAKATEIYKQKMKIEHNPETCYPDDPDSWIEEQF